MYQNSERKIIKFDILDCLIWGNIFYLNLIYGSKTILDGLLDLIVYVPRHTKPKSEISRHSF
jgi:hypothetical protein